VSHPVVFYRITNIELQSDTTANIYIAKKKFFIAKKIFTQLVETSCVKIFLAI